MLEMMIEMSTPIENSNTKLIVVRIILIFGDLQTFKIRKRLMKKVRPAPTRTKAEG